LALNLERARRALSRKGRGTEETHPSWRGRLQGPEQVLIAPQASFPPLIAAGGLLVRLFQTQHQDVVPAGDAHRAGRNQCHYRVRVESLRVPQRQTSARGGIFQRADAVVVGEKPQIAFNSQPDGPSLVHP